MTNHLNDDDLVLHYYGEMPAVDESRAEAHLSTCGACRQKFARLQRVMATVDSVPIGEAPDGFERVAWARLEPALSAHRTTRTSWFRWFAASPARLAWIGGVLVLIAGAFVAGRLSPWRATPTSGPAQAAAAATVRERVLLVNLSEHLDRSQMVLVELVSSDQGGSRVDISSERSRAEQLLADNRLYRQTAVRTGDKPMAALLDDLERVLVDVAAAPSTVSSEDLDAIRQRIDAQELLFKVRVVSSQVRERQKAALQARRPLDTTKS